MPTDTIPPAVRSWLYGIATALGPILGAYGVVADETWPLILALVAAVLGTGTAAAYRPTRVDADR